MEFVTRRSNGFDPKSPAAIKITENKAERTIELPIAFLRRGILLFPKSWAIKIVKPCVIP